MATNAHTAHQCASCHQVGPIADAEYDGEGRLLCRWCRSKRQLESADHLLGKAAFGKVYSKPIIRPRYEKAAHLIRHRRARPLLAVDDPTMVVDVRHSLKRLRARRALQLVAWAALVAWPGVLGWALLSNVEVWLYMLVGFPVWFVTIGLVRRVTHVPERDTAGEGNDTTLPRILVFRRFAYHLDLSSLASLLPVLASLGRICFLKNPENDTLSGMRDPGAFDSFASDEEPEPSWGDRMWHSILGRAPQPKLSPGRTKGVALASMSYLHPTRYLAQLPKGTIESCRVTAPDEPRKEEAWKAEAKRLVTVSDFVVVDLTGFNENLRYEMELAMATLPRTQVILLCRSRGWVGNRILRVNGMEVGLYAPSMWGTGKIGEYIIQRIQRALVEGRAAAQPIMPSSAEVLPTLSRFGREGERAAISIPVEIHLASLALACSALYLVVLGFRTPSIGYKYILAGLTLGPVALFQYIFFIVRWMKAAAASYAAGDAPYVDARAALRQAQFGTTKVPFR
jgi:hypothetical protein